MNPHVEDILTRVWRPWQIIATVAVLIIGALTAFGWTFQKPASRISAVEAAMILQSVQINGVVKEYTDVRATLETVVRLQCLSLPRRDAEIAGACVSYPTKDEAAVLRKKAP